MVAAIIAASVSFVTLIGTLAAQYFWSRAPSKDTEKTLEEQSKQLDRTLAEQRTRTLNERFATAADRLGSDKPPAVRLAGVYAMAGLADDWEENRQTCIDVLCAYLRMPYDPWPGDEAPMPQRLAFQANREARQTVIRVIAAHLKEQAAVPWQCLNFDFTGIVFDGGDFRDVRFSNCKVGFSGAEFSGHTVDFSQAEFSGGTVDFSQAKFSGAAVDFRGAKFSGGAVYFGDAEFSGGLVSFSTAEFSAGTVSFIGAEFPPGGSVDFDRAVFSGSAVVLFPAAAFSGGSVRFSGAVFSGGEIDFSGPADWSSPPEFPWTDTPPSGVKLPRKEDQSQV